MCECIHKAKVPRQCVGEGFKTRLELQSRLLILIPCNGAAQTLIKIDNRLKAK